MSGLPLTDAELALVARNRWNELRSRLRREPLARTEQEIEARLDAAFEPTYARIPAFLDWHYSVAGQYTQLAQTTLGRLLESEAAQAALDRLQTSPLGRTLLERLGESEAARAAMHRLQDSETVRAALDGLRQGVDSRLFLDLPDRIRAASVEVEQIMKDELRALVEQRIRDEVQTLPTAAYAGDSTPCSDAGITDPRIVYASLLQAATPQTLARFTASAAPSGILAAGAAVRGGAAAGALVRRLSGRLLSRAASRAAGTVGTALGGVAAGAAAWLLVDFAVLFVDERLNRDDLERELVGLVDERKTEVRAALAGAADEARLEALGAHTPSDVPLRR
ncbi:MAG: hypothetical protein F4Z60_09355 [Chloroflexi bacterium]|nr:hypothetical protein [Chloroflexota bacterium]